jgi:hypothetical protein
LENQENFKALFAGNPITMETVCTSTIPDTQIAKQPILSRFSYNFSAKPKTGLKD